MRQCLSQENRLLLGSFSSEQEAAEAWLKQHGMDEEDSLNHDLGAMDVLQEVVWVCGACFEENSLLVDASEGDCQDNVIDCAICCRPSRLSLSHQSDASSWACEAQLLA